MRIIQISDLHIAPNFDTSHEKIKIIKSMCEFIRSTIPKTEEIIFFVLGDIGDCGNPASYQSASIVFDYLLDQLRGWKVAFEFIPGNHDLYNKSFNDFDQFISKYQNTKHQFTDNPTFSTVYGDINFIFASSITHANWQNGQVDSESIERNIKLDLANVLILHHSLINEDATDHSSVSDVSSILPMLSKYKIEFVLHGHTHECRNIVINKNIQLIGTGSLLAKMDENDNNQFNIMQVQKGKINKIINCRYIAGLKKFLGYTIYPFGKEYADPLTIPKQKYKAVDHYIERKILPYSLAVSDSFTQYLSRDKKIPLLEAFKENNLILMLSDAGAGKSTELNQVAYLLSEDSNPVYPVRINLNTYVDQEIVALFPEEYRSLDSEFLFLIIDGYDEIEPQHVNCFKRRLTKYVEENPHVHILISSRSNFCRITSPDNGEGTFPNFLEYGLCLLEKADIIRYVVARGLAYEEFFTEMQDKGLADLQYIPFYLIHLISIYESQGRLPAKPDLMDELIAFSFKSDNKKYDHTAPVPLVDKKIELLKALSRIALSLQLLQRNYMTEDEYQELFSFNVRDLVRYSGVWKQVSGIWQFTHNNFREYLAAKCLLRMPLEELLNYITYSENKMVVKPEWINTLSFLIAIDPKNVLFDWLVKNSPNVLVKFEHDRISKEVRVGILRDIFSEYKEKNIWFRDDERDLARFSASNEAIDYLLAEIDHPVHFRAQYIALHILLNFDSYFDKTDDIRAVILSCCSNPQTRAHECRVAIKILGHPDVCREEITQKLMELFAESGDSDIRCGMYEYLIQTDNQDKYVGYFLGGISICNLHHETNGSELYVLNIGLKKLSTPAAVKEALIWFVEADHKYSFYDEDDICDSFCQKAETIYLAGDRSMFDTILKAFCIASNSFNTKYTNLLLRFFDNTNTRRAALEYLLNQDLADKLFVLESFIKDDSICMAYFADHYKNDKLSDSSLFVNFVHRMPQSISEFQYFSALIKEKEGIEIPKRDIINYEELRRVGEQNYFNSLFDETELKKLLDDLLTLYGNPDITYEQLKNIHIERSERRQDIKLLKWAICHNDFMTERAADFFARISWKSFSTSQIYRMLSSDSYNLSVNGQQKQFIHKLFNELIEKVDFNTAATFENDSSYSISWNALYAICFLRKFSFPCSESILLDMLMIPSHFFYNKDNENKKISFITAYVSEDKINIRIQYNIQNRKLMGDVFRAHVEYCSEHELDFAAPIALEACVDSARSSSNKRVVFEYLLKLKGEDYIYDKILPHADNDLFMDIIRELYNSRNSKLESAMIAKYETTGEQELLKYLIVMNSEYGIKQYAKILDETNKTPDFESQLPDITETIGCIKDIKFLPHLIEFSKFLFRTDFKDNEFGSLYGSLTKALTAMGANEHYGKVKHVIEELKNTNSDDMEYVGFCSRILDDIKMQYLKSMDKQFSIARIQEIIECIK